MPRVLRQLTIFVSATSESHGEVSALRRIGEDLSRRLEKTHQLTLRVVAWPDDVRPGVNVDPQAEINRQLGSDCDIYIGILGTRFGTPTPKAGSGTAEEFNAALVAFVANSRSLRVLFYFDRGSEDPFALDVEQLSRVRGFRDSLSAKGVIFRDFKDTAAFSELVNEHLYHLIVDEWRGEEWCACCPRYIAIQVKSRLRQPQQSLNPCSLLPQISY